MAGSETKWISCLHQNPRMSFAKEIWPWHRLGRCDIPIEACRSPARLRRGCHCIWYLNGLVVFRFSTRTAMLQRPLIQVVPRMQGQKQAVAVKLAGSTLPISTSHPKKAPWKAFASPTAKWPPRRIYRMVQSAGAGTLLWMSGSVAPTTMRTSASQPASKRPSTRSHHRYSRGDGHSDDTSLPVPLLAPHQDRLACVASHG